MIPELQDAYEKIVKPLDQFTGAKNQFESGLEYRQLWAKTLIKLTEKLEEVSRKLQKDEKYNREQLKAEIVRILEIFKAKMNFR